MKWSALVLVTGGVAGMIGSLLLTPWLFEPNEFSLLKFGFRALLLQSGMLLCVLGGWKLVRHSGRAIWRKAYLSLTGLLLVLVLLETVFSFLPISAGGSGALSARLWFNRHWRENDLGYRDLPPKVLHREGQPNILVLGDSYTAGHGIDDQADRFTDRLREAHPGFGNIYNVARCGASPAHALGYLQSFPIAPDHVWYVHTPNDIETAAPRKEVYQMFGLTPEHIHRYNPDRPAGFLYAHSFLWNFVRTRLYDRQRRKVYQQLIDSETQSGTSFLKQSASALMYLSWYLQPTLLRRHVAELEKLKRAANARGADLKVLLFPPVRPKMLAAYRKQVEPLLTQALNASGMTVYSLSAIVAKVPAEARQAGAYDAHPSAAVHAAVSQAIAADFKQLTQRATTK